MISGVDIDKSLPFVGLLMLGGISWLSHPEQNLLFAAAAFFIVYCLSQFNFSYSYLKSSILFITQLWNLLHFIFQVSIAIATISLSLENPIVIIILVALIAIPICIDLTPKINYANRRLNAAHVEDVTSRSRGGDRFLQKLGLLNRTVSTGSGTGSGAYDGVEERVPWATAFTNFMYDLLVYAFSPLFKSAGGEGEDETSHISPRTSINTSSTAGAAALGRNSTSESNKSISNRVSNNNNYNNNTKSSNERSFDKNRISSDKIFQAVPHLRQEALYNRPGLNSPARFSYFDNDEYSRRRPASSPNRRTRRSSIADDDDMPTTPVARRAPPVASVNDNEKDDGPFVSGDPPSILKSGHNNNNLASDFFNVDVEVRKVEDESRRRLDNARMARLGGMFPNSRQPQRTYLFDQSRSRSSPTHNSSESQGSNLARSDSDENYATEIFRGRKIPRNVINCYLKHKDANTHGRLKAVFSRNGLKFNEIKEDPDHNCLFRALSRAETGRPDYHSSFRRTIVDYIRNNLDYFRNKYYYVDDEHVQRMHRDREWGTMAEIEAFAHSYNYHVIVQNGVVESESEIDVEGAWARLFVGSNGEDIQPHHFHPEGYWADFQYIPKRNITDNRTIENSETKYLFLLKRPNHYDSLVPDHSSTTPRAEQPSHDRTQSRVTFKQSLVENSRCALTWTENRRVEILKSHPDASDNKYFSSNSVVRLVGEWGANMPQINIHSETNDRRLNDEVLELYLKLLDRHYNSKEHCFFEPYFLGQYRDPLRGTIDYDIDKMKRQLFKKVKNLSDCDKLYFPLNIGTTHWALIVLSISFRSILYYDSSHSRGGRLHEEAQRAIEAINNMASDYLGSLEFADMDMPQQTNNYDCGAFVLACCECLGDDKPLNFSNSNMELFRRKILLRIDADNVN